MPAMRVGQRSGLAAQRAGCPQLRRLEARVHASQVPGSGHSGLGYSEVVHDCTPPIGAEVLPPLSHAPAAMEVEGQPPPSQPPSESPMEWASRRAGSGADRRAVGSVRQLPSAIWTATSQPSLEIAQPSHVTALPVRTPGSAQFSQTSSLLPLELPGVTSADSGRRPYAL